MAKLGFVCSPSVITGDPVALNFSIVSRTASMHINANSPCDMLPRSYCINAVISFCGRGMLPIGSVGIVISKSRKNLDPGKRSNRRPLRLDDSEMTVEPLRLGSRTTESLAASSWSVSLGASLCLPHELALHGLIRKKLRVPTSTLASRLFLRTAFGPGPFRLFAVPTPGSKNWRSIDDLAELEARERVVVHAHLSRLGRLRKICTDHNHPFLSPNTSAGKARRDKLLLAEINPLLVRRGRLYPGEGNERHRRLLRMQRGRLHVIENAHTSFSQVRGCIAGNVWIKPSNALNHQSGTGIPCDSNWPKLLSQGTRAKFLKKYFDLEQLDRGRLNRPCDPHRYPAAGNGPRLAPSPGATSGSISSRLAPASLGQSRCQNLRKKS